MIRIIEEDRELEMFVSERAADIAVPFEISRESSEDFLITVYPSFRPVAEKFCELFSEAPFCPKADEFLRKKLAGVMDEWGYEYDPKASETILLYKATEISLKEEETAVLLEVDEVLPSLLTFRPQVEEGDPLSLCAVVISKGEIVSAAQINDLSFDAELPEINVETAVGYRAHGYAASCTRVLSNEILKYYLGVLYAFRERNSASARVAESAGFRRIGERKAFVCYQKE